MSRQDIDNPTAFASTGVFRLPHFVPRSRTEPAKAFLLSELKRLRILENGQWRTKHLAGGAPLQIAVNIANKLPHDPVLDAVASPELLGILFRLAGTVLHPAQAHLQVLITPPQKGTWLMPTQGWHVDIALPSREYVPGLQVFVLLDDLAPQGGGTLAILGSHRDRDLVPSPTTVLEMCGRAGDVFVMDIRVRHAASPNARSNARWMLTGRYLRRPD